MSDPVARLNAALEGRYATMSDNPLRHVIRETHGRSLWQMLGSLVALFFVVPATFYFIYWVPFSLVPLGEQRWIAAVVSLPCALAVGRFVWVKLASEPRGPTSSERQGLGASVFLGAVLLGGLGFTGGFLGPIIFTPEANQGPLLGIFITGPLGFLVGGIAGFVYWARRGRRTSVSLRVE